MTEHEFMRRLMLALGRRADLRIWRQNVGSIPVRDDAGRIVRVFHSGIPKGAADISGFVRPEGWRFELEIKGPETPVTPEQEHFARLLRDGGCVVAQVRYDARRTLAANVAAGVRLVDDAIRARRAACPRS
jgi:hypothetical protein